MKQSRGQGLQDRKKRLAAWVSKKREGALHLLLDIRKANLPRLFLMFATAVLISALLVFIVEDLAGNAMFSSFFDAVWWAVVTIATVGYGDKYPVTEIGKVVGIVLIAMGMILLALLSGTIASIFVERRIREGKGLQDIRMKSHIVLCGWNANAASILASFAAAKSKKELGVALVNSMEPEDFEALTVRFAGLDLRFVRGDFTNEAMLKRASIEQAYAAVIIPDSSMGNSLANADERTILASLAIKSIKPDINLSAELSRPENAQHLKRANVDNILVNGEYAGFLLSESTQSRGIPAVVSEILSYDSPSRLRQIAVPAGYVGRKFIELAEHLMRGGQGVLIGVLSRDQEVSLHDMLSDDSSAIDAFIKKKFRDADIDMAEEGKSAARVTLNPGPDYVVQQNDAAFVIG